MEDRPPPLAHPVKAPLRHRRSNCLTFTPPPGGCRRPGSTTIPSRLRLPPRPHFLPRMPRNLALGRLPATASRRAPCCLGAGQKVATQGTPKVGYGSHTRGLVSSAHALVGSRAAPISGDVACGGGAKVCGGRVGEEERGERGRQSGERKVRKARTGSETRESVRHCGPEKRRARGEEERASGRDGPLPSTPQREALFLASQRAAAAAAAGTVNSAEGGSQLL